MLNALRHHREEHRLDAPPRHPERVCSTPCGITGRSTSRPPLTTPIGPTCSTPCGITGRSTSSSATARAPRRRAQRLAASPGGAPQPPLHSQATTLSCSTPCGITGRSTCADAWAGPGGALGEVLNALRHHREEHATTLSKDERAAMCSTPCGITGRSTRHPPGRRRHRHCVLNALRHHREEDSSGTAASSSSGEVCSTPCGITGRSTISIRAAFEPLPECSTPCGITGRSTWPIPQH